MSRRTTEPQPGLLAQFSTECYRCGELIVRNQDRIVFNRGRALHVACHSGADDE